MTTTLDTPFDTDTEEGTRKVLPDGKYKAQVVDAQINPLKSGRGQGVTLTWCISYQFHNALNRVFSN
jgi:hypothetical protein